MKRNDNKGPVAFIAAAQVLEIDEDDASRIFYSDNDRVALERLADLIEENR